ncbi:sodium/potassium-transporting ATPase subunit alpha [Syntrophus gentianae]|uniref:Sodium/potassium-transporting ATPase subunit alpha n=1 Tax=Syntrophus gentianae TaxID=43775 RepID=A0A1H7UXF5_9BACT|nr:cation-transporting P-type ATPase [Syntrophus gentianae]SEM01623.1 sodium/potassium-transporting ATPase subunit alpha [Syntrophus gentianae]
MKINSLSKEEALRALVSSENGLPEAEAAKRLSESGFNEIREVRRTSLAIRFFRQFTHFLALLLWVGAGLAFLSDYLHPGEDMATLGFAIIGVIMINAVFTFIQEYRAEKALEALKKLLPFYVQIVREGKERKVPSREVVPGDIILLSEGDRIPADARLIEGAMLKVNNASLTGESEASLRNSLPVQGELLDSPNIVFAGTTVTSGSGKALVFATGMGTEFGRIAHLTSTVQPDLSPLQKEIVKATRLVATIAALVGIFFFALGFAIGRDFWNNFIFAIGITVALIPEGMLPTVTLSLAMASQRMAKRKALIKNLSSAETLGCVSVICTDKTGTLTQNRMTAEKIWKDGSILDAKDFRAQADDPLMQTALFCNNARFADNEYLGDPTETALLRLGRESLGDLSAQRIFEIPFDSDRKRMTTVHRVGNAEYVFSKGAMESILPLCSRFLTNGVEQKMEEASRESALDAYSSLMDKGLRVLAFAYKKNLSDSLPADPFSLEKDFVFAGLIGLEDPPRPEVPEAIRKCHEAGIKVIVITGDGSRTAVAIAREIGLVKGDPIVIEGPEFLKMDDRELRKKLAAREILFARMAPKHKMRVVSILQEEGQWVAVTGDGVNDAPALKKADIGIAMGISGTDVAKEASDMILLDDNFATIVNAVEEGRTVYDNIRKFITYIFASNIPEAVPFLAYILLRIPLPLTIMQILAVDLGTDMLPALALGTEKPTPAVMKQPPRSRNERLLNFSVLSRAYLFLGPIEAAACMFGFFYVLYGGGWTWGTLLPLNNVLYLQATTACLTAIIIVQIGNVFACRSANESVLSLGFFSNRFIFIGIAFELCLQLFIVYSPFGNRIFATHPLPPATWFILLPFALLLFFGEETRKHLVLSR